MLLIFLEEKFTMKKTSIFLALIFTSIFCFAQNVNDGFVKVPSGTFTMGSPKTERMRNDDEKQHLVSVSSFYVSAYEVSQKQYREVTGKNPSYFKGDDLPVENVTWFDAIEYCNLLSRQKGLTPCYTVSGDKKTVTWNKNANGYRLLTEAEWEYAHRAGTTGIFLTQNYTTSNQANFYGCYPYLIEENYLRHTNKDVVTGPVRDKTVKVDSFDANAFGLYNTAGNVAEWCWDFYGEYDGSMARAVQDPAGTKTGSYRIIRGGGYNDFGKQLRSAYRSLYPPFIADRNTGFRVCRNDSVKAQSNADNFTTTSNTSALNKSKPKILVAYFSYSGNTERAAKQIAQKTGATLFEIEMKNPYRGNIYQVSQEDLMQNVHPPLTRTVPNAQSYDVILLGYPTWWSTIPMPVATFLQENNFAGKELYVFSSHGGTIYGESVTDVCRMLPNTFVGEPFEFHYSGGANLSSKIDDWLKIVNSKK